MLTSVLTSVFALTAVLTCVGGHTPQHEQLQGNNSCLVSSGTLTFRPPLRTHGDGQRSYVTAQLKLSSCSNSGARSGYLKASPYFVLKNDSCGSLRSTGPVGGNILWSPRKKNLSTDISFNNGYESLGPPISLRFTGGTAYGGSFDGSARSRLNFQQTGHQVTTACRSSSGLQQLIVASGSLKVGRKY
jgi:hypothetical protein